MGFKITIEGPETIKLGKEIVKDIQASLSTPGDSRARSTKDLATLSITGNLYTIAGGENTDTIKLFQWAQIPAEQIEEAYRNVTVEIETDNQTFRKIQYPNAFVIDYNERYNDTAGYGQFTLILRQRSDKTAEVKVDGGLPLGGEGAGGGQAGADAVASAGAAPAAAPPVAAAAQSMKTPSAMNAATTGGIAGGIAGGAAAGSIAKTMQNAAKAAVQQAAQQAVQKTLQKADPSGAAAAATTSLTQAAQNPEAFAQQTMQTATAQETAKLMQKAKQPDMGNMIKGF